MLSRAPLRTVILWALVTYGLLSFLMAISGLLRGWRLTYYAAQGDTLEDAKQEFEDGLLAGNIHPYIDPVDLEEQLGNLQEVRRICEFRWSQAQAIAAPEPAGPLMWSTSILILACLNRRASRFSGGSRRCDRRPGSSDPGDGGGLARGFLRLRFR